MVSRLAARGRTRIRAKFFWSRNFFSIAFDNLRIVAKNVARRAHVRMDPALEICMSLFGHFFRPNFEQPASPPWKASRAWRSLRPSLFAIAALLLGLSATARAY